MRKSILFSFHILLATLCFAQTDTLPVLNIDTSLRIVNVNPYFTQHVDSSLSYKFEINRTSPGYYWYLKNSPLGLKINKDNGLLSFKAEKSYFLSNKLKYDYPYRVTIGVQSLTNPLEKTDTSFSLLFYNTEIIASRVKPSVWGTLFIDEGDTASFTLQCETGSFPIEEILFSSDKTIKNHSVVRNCGDEFTWSPDYDFVKGKDSMGVNLSFIGSTKFKNRDTAIVHIVVRDALNYPHAIIEYNQAVKTVNTYVLRLKYSFLQLDKGLKKNKTTRTTFDLTGAATALTGTILTTSGSAGAQNTGKVLPGVGIALVPVKEATAPTKVIDQNQASAIRTSIKRLDYMLTDNSLIGEKDPDILKKTAKLKDELKQVQIQLIDIPVEITSTMSQEELNNYFNSPKVNKKYRLKKRG